MGGVTGFLGKMGRWGLALEIRRGLMSAAQQNVCHG